MRTLTPIELSAKILSVDSILAVVNSDGHYLGEQETLKRMQTDFLYPSIADRRDHESWTATGSHDIRTVANQRARELLSTHYPSHLNLKTDDMLRNNHDIKLPRELMQAT